MSQIRIQSVHCIEDRISFFYNLVTAPTALRFEILRCISNLDIIPKCFYYCFHCAYAAAECIFYCAIVI